MFDTRCILQEQQAACRVFYFKHRPGTQKWNLFYIDFNRKNGFGFQTFQFLNDLQKLIKFGN